HHCISPDVENALKLEAQSLVKILFLLNDSIDEVEKHMSEILNSHRPGRVFKSLPGAGDVTAAKILGLLGDNPDRFDSASAIQCLMGTAPMNYQSGSYRKVIMRRACNKRGRALFYYFAFSS